VTDDATPPPPIASRRRGPGCLFWLIALPVVVVLGLVLGRLASGDDDEDDEDAVTLAEGTAGGGWRVDAVRDVEGEVCVFIYVRGEQSTGGCGDIAQDETLDDGAVTIVFGKAPRDADRVVVPVEPGEPVEVETVAADGIEGRFFVAELEGDLDAAGTPEVRAE
jgi:hypothetical protein